jgi:hypothetical protein
LRAGRHTEDRREINDLGIFQEICEKHMYIPIDY